MPGSHGMPAASNQQADIRFGIQYINGCSERMKGNLKEALTLFEECRSLNPQNTAVYYEIGTIYKLLGANDLALKHAKVCAAADPKNEWYQLLLIDCYNAGKQYSQAIKIRETLVKNYPGRNEFKEELAIEYAITGQYDKSFKLYNELEKTYGVNEQLTLNKLKLLKSQGKAKEAETELKRLLATDPSQPRYYSYLAEFYTETGNLEAAKSMYDKIVELDPNNPSVNLALHDYYMASGKRDLAYDYLKKAFENPELDAGTKSAIAGDYYKRAELGDQSSLKQGMELGQIAVNVHPNSSEANATLADFYRLNKNVREAARYYYLASVQERKNVRVWEHLLFADNDLANYDSLERHSAKAMELFPSLPLFYLYNGVANAQVKNYKKASQSLKDGLEFVSGNQALMMDFLRSLGDAYHSAGEYDKSDKAFEDALKLDSDNTYVLNNYAYYLSLRNDRLDRAEKLSRRSNELQPNNRSYMDTYGWILYQQKRYSEAEVWLSKAAGLGPKNPTILEHYGDVLFKLNKPEEALKRWNEAKEAGGNSDELIKKIKEKKLSEK